MVGRIKGITELNLDAEAIQKVSQHIANAMPDVVKGAMNADPAKTFGQWASNCICDMHKLLLYACVLYVSIQQACALC